VVLCNDDSSAGWQEGLHRLHESDDPLTTLEEWRRDTVEHQLLENQRRKVGSDPKVSGNVIVTSSGYYAACMTGLDSGPAELRGFPVDVALRAFSECLSQCRIEMQEHLLAWKTAGVGSATYIAGEELARNLCNLTLQMELLKHLLDPDRPTTVYFKREWTPADSETLEKVDQHPYRPTWSTGWYMHLLHTQFGIQFPHAAVLLAHLDTLQESAKQYAEEYAQHHSGGNNETASDAVALKLVAVKEVVGAMISKAEAVERTTSGLLTQLCDEAGGEMVGFENRFKTERSLFRKLIQRLDRQLKSNEHIPSFVPSLSAITKEVDDVLRYTIVLPHDQYTAGVRSVIAGLTASGSIAVDVYAMNYWCEEENCTTYMGINSFVNMVPEKSPDGAAYAFELQFHTEESIVLKNGTSHDLYELFRSPGVSQEEKLRHYTELKRVWNEVPVPEEICEFGHHSVFIDRATEVLIGLQEDSAQRLLRTATAPDRVAKLSHLG